MLLFFAGATWGITHPPGYPLFTILMGIAVNFFGQGGTTAEKVDEHVAWRANAVNAILSSLAAAFLCLVGLRLSEKTNVLVTSVGVMWSVAAFVLPFSLICFSIRIPVS